ncbi:MAG: hypothetical protein Q7T55_15670 [Solirubrobacteraceae bacterium]|nr:hypothetical protein [Solirubrobacteraceae bacterium]
MSSLRQRGREALVYLGFLPGTEETVAPEASPWALLLGAIAAGAIFGLLTWLFEDRTTVSTILSGVIFGVAMFAATLWTRSRSRDAAAEPR